MRWLVDVTFHDVRTHLGVETQRHWSDLAMVRTTPALLGLFSLVTLGAHPLLGDPSFPVRQAAWDANALPTFSDTLALVRQHVWPSCFCARSTSPHEVIDIPRALFDHLVNTLAFPA
jgi:hypothetical protein